MGETKGTERQREKVFIDEQGRIKAFKVYREFDERGMQQTTFRVEGPLFDKSYIVVRERGRDPLRFAPDEREPVASDSDEKEAYKKAYELAKREAKIIEKLGYRTIVDLTSRAKQSELEAAAQE